MKQKAIAPVFLLLGLIILSASVRGSDEVKEEEFTHLRERVQDCLNVADIGGIQGIFAEISEDSGQGEDFYQGECERRNITRWPSQETFREAYFGEVFYPDREISLFYEHDSNEYILKRFDVISSLAVSARFKNPLALYYLTEGFYIHIRAISGCNTDFIHDLYKKALQTLEQVEGNDAVYLLRARDYILGHRGYHFNVDKAFDLYAQSHDQEAKFQMLFIRGRYTMGHYDEYKPPSREEYLALSETYPKAYLEMAEKGADSFEEKEKLLTCAYEKGYKPALLALGVLYQDASKKEEALKCYEDYGALGYPAGYLYISTLHAGRVDISYHYQKKPDEAIGKAIEALRKGHLLYHPEASYRLGILLLEMNNRSQNPAFEEEAVPCFERAAILGKMVAYQYIIDDSLEPIYRLLKSIKGILVFTGYCP